MPNWCHVSLTVTGKADEVARFVENARPSEELIRSWWEKSKTDRFEPETRPFEEYLAAQLASQPLSLDALVPQPSEEEYEEMDKERKTATCRYCGGKGKRPVTQEEADSWEVPFFATANLPDVPFDDRQKCNSCSGTGKTFPEGQSESWYEWRLRYWGVKWDVSFEGSSMFMMGAETMDPELTMAARGVTATPTVAIYKFDTPWSSPSAAIERTSEDYPALTFQLRFGEAGNGFAGEEVYQQGICISSDELSVEEVLAPEEMWF